MFGKAVPPKNCRPEIWNAKDRRLSGAELDNAFCLVSDYVIGTTAIHLSYDAWLASDLADIETTRAYLRDAVRPYPRYAEYIDGYIAGTDAATRRERRYAYALQCLLDGLASRIDRDRD